MEEAKLTNLSFLEIYSGNNPALIRKLIQSFLDKTPAVLNQMEEQVNANDLFSLSRTAHTLKPQLSYMGIKRAEETTKEIEECAKEQKDIASIPQKMDELKQMLQQSYAELNDHLSRL